MYKNLKFRELWQDQNLWAENLDTVLLPDIMEEEVKVENSLSHKSFLILLKYIPHFIAFGYVLTTLLEFLGFNMIVFGYFIHLSYCRGYLSILHLSFLSITISIDYLYIILD